MSIAEIETAIRDLPESEFWQLSAWFDELRASAWDARIVSDADAGKLDFLFQEAAAEYQEEKLTNWPKES